VTDLAAAPVSAAAAAAAAASPNVRALSGCPEPELRTPQ